MNKKVLASHEVVNQGNNQSELQGLTEEETKHFLTPFAFKMDESLFGLPLASPSRRGIAILIDLALIALLAEISGGILALAIAITLYRLGNTKRAQTRGKITGYKRRAVLRFFAALMAFIVLLDTLPPILDYFDSEDAGSIVSLEENELSIEQSLVVTGYAISVLSTIADSTCVDLPCWQDELLPVSSHIAQIAVEGGLDMSESGIEDIFKKITEATKLSQDEQAQLIIAMQARYDEEVLTLQSNQLEISEAVETVPEKTVNKPVYSVIEWVKGIIKDLGLGFGWATFYFTASTALWHGQTLGKKLLGIKVLQLDGTPLSLWDSFGRYGGYGAGIATGLLGFIQIYWDPNRQAIHDKISATVVIDIRKSPLDRAVI